MGRCPRLRCSRPFRPSGGPRNNKATHPSCGLVLEKGEKIGVQHLRNPCPVWIGMGVHHAPFSPGTYTKLTCPRRNTSGLTRVTMCATLSCSSSQPSEPPFFWSAPSAWDSRSRPRRRVAPSPAFWPAPIRDTAGAGEWQVRWHSERGYVPVRA